MRIGIKNLSRIFYPNTANMVPISGVHQLGLWEKCVFLGCGLFKINVAFFSTGDTMQKYFHVMSHLRLTHFGYFQEKLFMLKEIKYQKQIWNVPAASFSFSTLIL